MVTIHTNYLKLGNLCSVVFRSNLMFSNLSIGRVTWLIEKLNHGMMSQDLRLE